MNAYTTRGQARIQPRDIATALRTQGLTPGASIAALERQRGWQAEAEMERLLQQYGATSHASTSRVSQLRQRIGAALVHAGERLAGVPHGGDSLEAAPTTGMLGLSG